MRTSNPIASLAAAVGCSILAILVLCTPTLGANEPPQPVAALLGFNDHPLDSRASVDPNIMLDGLVELGGGFVRIDVHWPWLEWGQPGRANWSQDQVKQLDRYLDAAQARGIHGERPA